MTATERRAIDRVEFGKQTSAQVVIGSGWVRLTLRDAEVIGWIAEHYAVRVDVISRVLNPDGAYALGRTRRVLARWRTARVVQSREFQARTQRFVWPTQAGMVLAGLEYRAKTPSVATLAHHHAVAVTRLAIEQRKLGTGWVSERRLTAERANPTSHIPDGLYINPAGDETAVEVELTLKSKRRLRNIVAHLATRYPRILYVTGNGAITNAVRAATDDVDVREQVTVVKYRELLKGTV